MQICLQVSLHFRQCFSTLLFFLFRKEQTAPFGRRLHNRNVLAQSGKGRVGFHSFRIFMWLPSPPVLSTEMQGAYG